MYTLALPCPALCTGSRQTSTKTWHEALHMQEIVGGVRLLWTHASSTSTCYMLHIPLAIQMFLCLALVARSRGQQMPKPTTKSIHERLWKAEVIGVALAVARGDTALEWQ